MEKEDIEGQLKRCPFRIRMNEGLEYMVEKPEFITIGDYTVSVLLRRDGAMRHTLLSLMNITAVEPLEQHAEN
ncbi:MAG: hypothetical protein ACRCT8_13615 [Lacipirellulaceae bacterium]